jgi:hypothetical protein
MVHNIVMGLSFKRGGSESKPLGYQAFHAVQKKNAAAILSVRVYLRPRCAPTSNSCVAREAMIVSLIPNLTKYTWITHAEQ